MCSARRSLPGAGAAAAPAPIDERRRRRRRPRRSPSSRAQFAYSYYLYRQARERGDVTATWPNSLVAFVWWLCAIELVLTTATSYLLLGTPFGLNTAVAVVLVALGVYVYAQNPLPSLQPRQDDKAEVLPRTCQREVGK